MGPVLSFVEGCTIPLREIRCVSNLLRHNSACGRGPEMGIWGELDGLVEWGVVYGQVWWGCFMSLVRGSMRLPFKVGIFVFQMTFSSVGCCGGPEMFCGLEMVELLCD